MNDSHIDGMDKLLFEIMHNGSSCVHQTVYHYTKAENITNILQPKDIHIRMTHYEDFADKLEGKVVDAYLDLALEKLLKEMKITKEIYSSLTPKNLPTKELFAFNLDSKSTYGKSLECDTYIVCFCKEKDYQYMYDNYSGYDGYCIGFSELGINEIYSHSFGKGFKVEYHSIMYGKEVIEYFYKKILELLSVVEKLPEKTINLKTLLNELRKRVQYSSKLYGYSDEKEVRLVLKIPKEHTFKTDYPFTFGYDEERKRRYLELTLPKYCCLDVNCQNPPSDVLDYLEKNNYRYNAFG